MNTSRSVWLSANTSWYLVNFRRTLITRLQSEGFSVAALSPKDDYTHELEKLGVRHIPLVLNKAGANPVREAMVVLRLAALFSRERPVILLTYTPKMNIYGCLAARAARIPVVANISGLGRAFIRGGWLAGVVRFLYHVSLRSAGRVFFQNPDDMKMFLEQRLVACSKSVLLPGSGVDTQRFAPSARRVRADRFIFLLAGRLLRDKGIIEYVDAARIVRREYPHAEFRIVGFFDTGNPSALTHRDVAEWEADGLIRYLGSSEDIVFHYAQSDCVVLPSYREGCPRTLLEAASMCIPLIATDVPGCRWVVEHEVNGFLCRAFDAVDLSDKMVRMLSLSESQRAGMGAAGRRRMVLNFDEKIVLEEYIKAVKAFARA